MPQRAGARAVILEVAVPAPLMTHFDYLPPSSAVAGDPADPGAAAIDRPLPQPGQRVRVPFGRSTRIGLITRIKPTSERPAGQLRRVLAVLDETPLLPPDVLKMINWASAYYQHPPGEVFAAAIPKALREGGSPSGGAPRFGLTAEGRSLDPETLRRAPVQRRLLDALRASPSPLAGDVLAAMLGAGWKRAVAALAARGALQAVREAPELPVTATPPDTPHVLTPEQATAVAAIDATSGYRTFLLDGVTGSGKTEVYLQSIGQVLASGRQALVLVPEIGLTPQLVDRFRRRFAVPIAVLHSGLADGERLLAWTAAANGSAAIVIGTRSAIFVPLARPGLVVVDEEHDTSYKQQDGFRYSARDLAVWRARELGVPLVLGSATPSLESLDNVREGRYVTLRLSVRAGAAGAPTIHRIDLRTHPPTDGLSQPLLAAVRRHLDAGGQALLYLNRRGFAPTLVCPDCGSMVECARCDARMVLHQQRARITCHHCGSERGVPGTCAECGGELRAIGQGTERIEQALASAFPEESIERIDRDTTRRRGEIERRLDRVRRRDARLLLGTQMLTKGHDFPDVTLVGIIDADQGLFGTDFRSAERLAQTVMQVAGRAGRADRPGEVYLQTLFPDHPLLRLLVAEGYGAFAERAIEERRAAGWPPLSFLALLRAESAQRAPAFAFLESAGRLARDIGGDVRILGPAPAPMERRAGRHRAQVLAQAPTRRALHAFLVPWRAGLDELAERKQVRWSLDVDPVELF